MTNFIAYINDIAELWLIGMERVLIRGSILFIILIIVSRIFSNFNFAYRDWLWKIAFMQLIIIFFWSLPVHIAVFPEEEALISSTQTQDINYDISDFEENRETTGYTDDNFESEEVQSQSNVEGNKEVESEGEVIGTTQDTSIFTSISSILNNNVLNIIDQINLYSFLFLIWLTGVISLLIYLIYSWKQSQKLIKSSDELTDNKMRQMYDKLVTKFSIKKKPELLISNKINSPLLMGLINPVIMLPEDLKANYNEFEIKSILAHELTHRKRYDLIWNFIISICQIIFFFNPIIWLGKKEWNIVQENACDYNAIEVTDIHRAKYCKLLVNSMNQRENYNFSIALMGVQESYQIIKRRLLQMKDIKQVKNKFSIKQILTVIILGGLLLIPWQFSFLTGSGSGILNYALSQSNAVEIEFEDANLKQSIREKIDKPEDPIYKSDVKELVRLEASGQEIESLKGIEHLENLRYLDLGLRREEDAEVPVKFNYINDISSLSNLTNLETLIFDSNNIKDLDPLKNLTDLKELSLINNEITDISAIKNLNNLEILNLANNEIKNFKPLQELINLRELTLTETPIVDLTIINDLNILESLTISEMTEDDLIQLNNLEKLDTLYVIKPEVNELSPLKDLTQLKELHLIDPENNLENIKQLENLTNLKVLRIYSNIDDITPLKALTDLEKLYLISRNIDDITPLENLTNLKELALTICLTVENIDPLEELTNLNKLYLTGNNISNIEPLVNNKGLGEGDYIDLTGNVLDFTEGSEDMKDIERLKERGVMVEYEKIEKTSEKDYNLINLSLIPEKEQDITEKDWQNLIEVIEKRLDSFDQLIDSYNLITQEREIEIEIKYNVEIEEKRIKDILSSKGEFKIKDEEENRLITQDYIENAVAEFDHHDQPVIVFQFNQKGTEKFAEITEEYLNERLYLYLDNNVLSSPVIKAIIDSGNGAVTGFNEKSEAVLTANLIQSPPLPFTIEVQKIDN